MDRGRADAVPPLVRRFLTKRGLTGSETPALYRAPPAEPTGPARPAQFGPLLRDVFHGPPSPLSTGQGLSWQD